VKGTPRVPCKSSECDPGPMFSPGSAHPICAALGVPLAALAPTDELAEALPASRIARTRTSLADLADRDCRLLGLPHRYVDVLLNRWVT
jgi:hypothetical protein